VIVAIDPGSEKCGLAVLNEDARVLHRAVVPNSDLFKAMQPLLADYRPTAVVIGRGAYGRKLAQEFANLNLIFVSEKDTTWLARRRYWRENPPAGWLRLIPTSLRVPPVPVDDLAAVIIGERYLNG
jgi:RNase H-fold protein (predicted Holliday junction resolvase)